MLSVEHLSVSFFVDGRETKALDDVSFAVPAGATLGLVGQSGCGKTTLALALMGLVDPPGRVVSGSIRFRGRELVGSPPRIMATVRGVHVAMVFQEPLSALDPLVPVGDQVAEPLVAHRALDWKTARRRAVELLAEVGLDEPGERARAYPHELSGGQRQRVAIAMALACDPALVIADEPTSALDVVAQGRITALLSRLQRERHMAMVVISHDPRLVRALAQSVVVMDHGHIVEPRAS